MNRGSPLLFALSLASSCPQNCPGSRVDYGSLTIGIVTPSEDESYLTNAANVPFGGEVGGWFILDPTPVIHWENEATGDSGDVGQLVGTWVVNGGVDLQPGVNRLTVRASNGLQRDATDAIVVTYQP